MFTVKTNHYFSSALLKSSDIMFTVKINHYFSPFEKQWHEVYSKDKSLLHPYIEKQWHHFHSCDKAFLWSSGTALTYHPTREATATTTKISVSPELFLNVFLFLLYCPCPPVRDGPCLFDQPLLTQTETGQRYNKEDQDERIFAERRESGRMWDRTCRRKSSWIQN